MLKKLKKAILILPIFFFITQNLSHAKNDPSFITISAGWFDFIEHRKSTLETILELRFGQKLWIFKPFVGVMGTADGTAATFTGFLFDLNLIPNLYITPSFAPTVYYMGNGKRLNYNIQFRSQIEISYMIKNGSRIGISVNHISNGHLSDPNPGVENITFNYILPFDKLFKE
jgi:hypothetical protein